MSMQTSDTTECLTERICNDNNSWHSKNCRKRHYCLAWKRKSYDLQFASGQSTFQAQDWFLIPHFPVQISRTQRIAETESGGGGVRHLQSRGSRVWIHHLILQTPGISLLPCNHASGPQASPNVSQVCPCLVHWIFNDDILNTQIIYGQTGRECFVWFVY